jgi:hypothetical protein
MKKITYLLLGLVFSFVATSCDDEDPDIIVMPDEAVVSPATLATPENASYVLSEETPDDVAATFTWTASTGEFNGNMTYYIVASKAGEDFNFVDAKVLDASTADLTLEVTHVQMNKPLIDLGLKAGKAVDVELRVMSVLNLDKNFAFSAPITVNVTPYAMETGAAKLTPFFMVGGYEQTGNWSPANAGEMNAVDSDDDGTVDFYEACLYLTAGNGIKFISNQGQKSDWSDVEMNLGKPSDDDATGTLIDGSESKNISVSEDGFYYVWLDVANLKYKVVKMNWGVIGGLNGWGAQEALAYDKAANTYSGSVTIPGDQPEFKLRSQNTSNVIFGDGEDWKYNIGVDDVTIRDVNASNFSKDAGTYTVTLSIDFKCVPTVTFE